MLVLGVNKILGWCQIVSNGIRHTCPTKYINGVLHFRFKKEWFKVSDFKSDNLEELVEVAGKVIGRPFKD